jgi:hypothetical protein
MAAKQQFRTLKGTQPRATEASLSRAPKPVSMDYRISGMKSYTPRTTSRSLTRRP